MQGLKLYLTISFFSLISLVAAQPFNSFDAARDLAADATVNEAVCSSSDYFLRTLLPANGTFTIEISGTNSSAGIGYLYAYVYDGRKGSGQLTAAYIGSTSVPAGGQTQATLTIPGQLSDSAYIRITSNRCFNFSISYSMKDVPPIDTEPNNTIEESVKIEHAQVLSGNVAYRKKGIADASDYYYTVLPDNGTVQIAVNGTNRGGGNGYMYMYAYDRRKMSGQILAGYVDGKTSVSTGASVSGTFTLYGRAKDTLYFRLIASQAFAYQLQYDVSDIPAADDEPNDNFNTAVPFAEKQTFSGNIGYYKNGGSDDNDYYATKLPEDGAMQVIVTITNRDGKNGYVYMYGYDKRKASGQQFATYIGGTSSIALGASIKDTLTVFGQLADSFYLRVTSNAAFEYSVQYTIVQDTQSEDPEPNNTFDQAIDIPAGIPTIARIGYTTGGVTDDNDYFKATLPAIGTLRVIVEGTNMGNANGWMFLYIYDGRRASGQLSADYVRRTSVAPEATVRDTFYVYGRMNEEHYLRMTSNRAFNYTIQYDAVNAPPADPEPNNSIATAVPLDMATPAEGNIGYFASGVEDVSDYYKLELPANGTLNVAISAVNNSNANGWVFVYVYDGRGLSGQILATYIKGTSHPPGTHLSDTLVMRGRAAGTYYVRVTSSRPCAYALQYFLGDPIPQDEEPNNTFDTAQPVEYSEQVSGNIGYVFNGADDANDYFSMNLPSFGTLRIIISATNMGAGNSWIYHYGYDGRKGSGQLFARYIKGTSNAPGTTVVDTITVSCRAIDSFYHRITSSGAWQYQWHFEMINQTTPEEEGNNTVATATTLPMDSTATDNIGYAAAGVTDANDYFITKKTGRGTIRYIVTATNTSASNGWLYGYIYEKRAAANPVQVAARFLGGGSSLPTGTTFTDTLEFNCSSFDSLYFRMTSSGCWTYTVTPEFIDREPIVKATYERMGNEFGFRAEQTNVDLFNWRFSEDNTTSTLSMPMRTYQPGSYNVRLIGQNGVCTNYRDTSLIAFDVFGVEYFTPDKGAAGGEAAITIYGGGLDTTTEVKLILGGTVLTPKALHGNSLRNKLTAEFDLHFADEGEYDVSILLPGIDTLNYPQSFTVSDLIYPYTTARIIAPALWRTGLTRTLQLSVENHGNVTATGVRVGVVWPKGMEVNWGELLRLPETGIDSVPNGSGGWYTVPRSALNPVYDEVESTTEISIFQGNPYNGYIRFFYVPHVPANGSVEIPFKAKANVSARHPMIAFSLHPNLFGSCGNEAQADLEDLMQAELLDFADDFADATKVPPFKLFVKTAKVGSKHMGSASSYYGKKFWAWKDGYEFDGDAAMADLMRETEINNQYALETAVKEIADLAGSKAIGKVKDGVATRVPHINKRLAANPNMSTETFDKYMDLLNNTTDQGKRVELLEKMFTNIKDADKALRRAQSLDKLAEDCPELKKQLEELKKNSDGEHNHRNTNRNNTETRTSFDPNDLFGPVGFNAERYVNNTDIQHFTVAFENIENAGADAQVVIIRDTLDKTVFDLDAFEFGSITIGEKYIKVPSGRKQLVLQRKLNDSIDVRINARLDTASGEALWVFTAIDRSTGDIPDFAGFLPPNQLKPEGEGYVEYKLKPLSGLPHLTPIRSRASIYFDQNEPIATGTWQNIIDLAPPSTTLAATRTGDTTIRVNIYGTDAHAGLASYNIFVSENNKEWILLSMQAGDSMLFEGRIDSTYRFYVVGLDSLRNPEVKSPVAEAVVTLSDPLPVVLTSFNGKALKEGNELQWTTSTEINNRGFYVEASLDSRSFTTLDWVPSKAVNGNSISPIMYQLLHKAPAARQYYRLRQTDLDGKIKLSQVILIERGRSYTLLVAPNPAVNQFRVLSDKSVEAVRLVDMQGRALKDFAPNGSNLYNLGNIPSGMYILQIKLEGEWHTHKLNVAR